MIIEKYKESNFILPCVVDAINYEKQLVLDIIQHKGSGINLSECKRKDWKEVKRLSGSDRCFNDR